MMNNLSDDTKGLLATLFSSHKDAKLIFHLLGAVVSIDILFVISGKPNLFDLPPEGALGSWAVFLCGLIVWALYQNMIAPLIAAIASNIVGFFVSSVLGKAFPNIGSSVENPNGRLLVSLGELESEICKQAEPDRLARFQQAREEWMQEKTRAMFLAQASFGTTCLIIAAWWTQGTVLSQTPDWALTVLLMAVSTPWVFDTLDFSPRQKWVIDPELAGRLHKQSNLARRSWQDGDQGFA